MSSYSSSLQQCSIIKSLSVLKIEEKNVLCRTHEWYSGHTKSKHHPQYNDFSCKTSFVVNFYAPICITKFPFYNYPRAFLFILFIVSFMLPINFIIHYIGFIITSLSNFIITPTYSLYFHYYRQFIRDLILTFLFFFRIHFIHNLSFFSIFESKN